MSTRRLKVPLQERSERESLLKSANRQPSKALRTLSYVLYFANRVYAHWSFLVNYVTYGFLYLFLGGSPPSFQTRPKKGHNPSIFVTGAHEGIGRATALHLARRGYTVFAGVRDPSHGRELRVEYLRNASNIGGDLHGTICDVLSQDDIQQCVDQISQFDQANPSRPFLALVNNAGFCMISPMELTSREDVQRMLDLDLLAYILTTRAFLPLLKRHSGGRVVNIGSYGGYTPVPGWVTYNAVKAAIDNMTRAWNFETMRAYGIKMTVVRPGWVATAGIGPKIVGAMERFNDEEVDLKAGLAASGFDSLGNVLRVEDWMDGRIMHRYTTMMEKWKTLVRTNTALGTPPEHVAKTVMDALTDAWLQPVYTVAWDALLAQMVRDFIPEPLYEWWVVKTLT